MKRQIITEKFDFFSAVKNFLGDTVRQAAGAVDFLGDPIVIASLYKNYQEISESLDRFETIKNQLLGPEMDLNYKTLKEEMFDIREDLEVDIIDTLQGFAELTPTSIAGSITSFIGGITPTALKLSIEDIVDRLHTVIPVDLDFPLIGTITNGLRAIYFIDNIEKVKQDIKPVHDNPDIFLSNILNGGGEMVQEGRKKTGTKLCSRGKSAAKSKFDVYPSAYANGYAIQVCKGKIKGLDGKKRCSPPYC